MEFWGAEVKPGQAFKVDQLEVFGAYIHITQVALGEVAKKGKASEPVVLYLKVGEQNLVLGTLNRDEIPQICLDLALDSEFELSHSSKNASVYFCGYREDHNEDEPFGGYDDYSESDDDDGALTYQDNGKPETKAEKEKVTESRKSLARASVKQAKVVDPKKDEDSDDESDDDNESDDEDESGSPDEMDADSDSDEDESDEDEEETPVKKVDQGKKRPNESASKTPASAKKAKNATPAKADGRKNAHTATPHPMKKGGKTSNSAAKDQTPKTIFSQKL